MKITSDPPAQAEPPDGDIITPQEAAAILKLHQRTIYKLLKEGNLPGARVGGVWRINRAALFKLTSRN